MKLSKIRKILTNQYFIIALITLLALFLRLLNIEKPCGLWYDEMLTYVFSSKSFPFGIMKTLLRYDFHMPLYYMYVHVWMKLFGINDTVLRYSSVLWGVLTIPAFFYLGKIYRSKNLGYLLAIIGALSPIMIYYSQEFRFYSMLTFLSTISIIFFLRLIETPNKKDFLFFFLSNLIILYIYTMGIIWVGIETLILLTHYYFYKKDYFSRLTKYAAVFFLVSIPYLILLFSDINASNNSLIDPLTDSGLKYYSIFIFLNNLFSPFIAGIKGSEIDKYKIFLKFPATSLILFFLSSATLCFITGFISSLRKFNKKSLYLITILISFLSVEIFLCIQQCFVLRIKYAIIILPIFFLICCDGLLLIKTKKLKHFLIGLIILVFIYNSVHYKKMESYSLRSSFIAFSAVDLKKLHLDKNDFVLYPNGQELLKKYVSNVQFIDFDIPSLLYLDKTKQERLKVFDKQFVLTTNKKNSPQKLIPYLLNPKPTNELKLFLNSSVKKIKRGNKLAFFEYTGLGNSTDVANMVISLNSGKDIKTKQKKYKEMLLSLLYVKINSDIKNALDENQELKRIKEIPPSKEWRIFVYEKQ